MARIIATGQTPAKKRHEHMRSVAEVLRILAQRLRYDEEAKDMVAFLVFNLRGIYSTIDESAQAWDDKGYWKKAEKLRDDWLWSRNIARELEQLVRSNQWDAVPPVLISLIPHVSSITINAHTRDSDWWVGACRALLREKA
ncbi:MAG: hypothetical protein RhofKO_02310 [Rhodothermales bacterium]